MQDKEARCGRSQKPVTWISSTSRLCTWDIQVTNISGSESFLVAAGSGVFLQDWKQL